MAKLYFKYGAMSCGKTRDLIKTMYNYKEKGMNVLIIKPRKDTKGEDTIVPRGAEPVKVDYLIRDNDDIYKMIEYYKIVDLLDIPVICYGLRVDFKGHLFPGSKALFETADSLEELKAVCSCGNKATRNIRYVNGVPTFDGGQVAIDGENNITYESVCRKCERKLRDSINKN